jgi:hypothetical protein
MITHKIAPHSPVTAMHNLYAPPSQRTVYTPPELEQEYEFRVPLGNGYMVTKINERTNKIVYTQWLSSLGFKRGDYVMHRRTVENALIRTPFNYLRVVGLQEMHSLCDYDSFGKAKCLELVAPSGTRFWTVPDEWRVQDAPEDHTWHFDLPTP